MLLFILKELELCGLRAVSVLRAMNTNVIYTKTSKNSSIAHHCITKQSWAVDKIKIRSKSDMMMHTCRPSKVILGHTASLRPA